MKAVFLPEDRAFIRYLEIPGADPPLLWLHGWQCSSSGELLPAAVQAPLRGRRSLLIDFLGHGYSDKPAEFAYTLEEHARTIVEMIDALGIERCGLVGHSMGGGVAVLAAASRPHVVSLLIVAEGVLEGDHEEVFDGQAEHEFAARGFDDLLREQRDEAFTTPTGLRAAHVGITDLIAPRALYREAVSMSQGTDPQIRTVLARLRMPRWYVIGELSDAENLQADLAAIGVGWKVVPRAGHPMALQNPEGFAQVIAEAATAAWPNSL